MYKKYLYFKNRFSKFKISLNKKKDLYLFNEKLFLNGLIDIKKNIGL